jgi:predicted  nucleic acid-binding Zn-ribbon protein
MTRDEFVAKMKQQLDEFNRRLDVLEKRGAEYNREVRERYEMRMGDLRRRRNDMAQRLEEINRAGDKAWEDLKSGATSAWNALQDGLKEALSKFK